MKLFQPRLNPELLLILYYRKSKKNNLVLNLSNDQRVCYVRNYCGGDDGLALSSGYLSELYELGLCHRFLFAYFRYFSEVVSRKLHQLEKHLMAFM